MGVLHKEHDLREQYQQCKIVNYKSQILVFSMTLCQKHFIQKYKLEIYKIDSQDTVTTKQMIDTLNTRDRIKNPSCEKCVVRSWVVLYSGSSTRFAFCCVYISSYFFLIGKKDSIKKRDTKKATQEIQTYTPSNKKKLKEQKAPTYTPNQHPSNQ